MNYFRQLKAFRIRKKLCQLTAPEIALWFALMSISNELGQYDRLSLSESTLREEAGLSRSSLFRARNSLKQHGFISWNSRKGNQAALYTMIDLCAAFQYGAQNETQDETQTEAQGEAENRAQIETIYKQNYTEQNAMKKIHYNDSWRTGVRARSAVAQNLIDDWKAGLDNNADFTGVDAHRIVSEYLEAGMTPAQIQWVLKGCTKPWYLENHLFSDAVHKGILTEDSYLHPQEYAL